MISENWEVRTFLGAIFITRTKWFSWILVSLWNIPFSNDVFFSESKTHWLVLFNSQSEYLTNYSKELLLVNQKHSVQPPRFPNKWLVPICFSKLEPILYNELKTCRVSIFFVNHKHTVWPVIVWFLNNESSEVVLF